MSLTQTINDRHETAMDLCEEGFFAKRKGDFETAKKLFHEAFILELSAAGQVPIDCEPTRSVLYSSAMYCAQNAGMFPEAIEVAETLLTFTPYEEYIQGATELINELKLGLC
jgi:hypothetical protein